MKRYLAMLLTLAMVFTLFACGSKKPVDNQADNESTAATIAPATEATKAPTVAPTEPPADAKTLIAQGNYEEAYKILYAQKSNPEAAELLKNFVWVYEKLVMETGILTIVTETHEYTYDADGKLIKDIQTTRYKNNSGGVSDGETETYEYTYDANGKLIKKEHGSITEEYSYDANGNCIGIDPGDDAYKHEYQYDEKGNVIQHIFGGYTSTCYEYTYNADERIIKMVETRYSESNWNGTTNYEYAYDSDGKLIRETGWGTTEYTYDSNGNLDKKVNMFQGETEMTEYTYDSYGNLTKEVCTTTNPGEGRPYTYEYSGYKLFYKPQK